MTTVHTIINDNVMSHFVLTKTKSVSSLTMEKYFCACIEKELKNASKLILMMRYERCEIRQKLSLILE
jgi:hypothetical protein